MKTFFKLAAIAAAALAIAACDTEYYEPVFEEDGLPEVIKAEGGIYKIYYTHQYFDTKSDVEYFEWEYRVVIGRDVVYTVTVERNDPAESFLVNIPSNTWGYARPVLIEISTHVSTTEYDYWGDWSPVCSSVQLAF